MGLLRHGEMKVHMQYKPVQALIMARLHDTLPDIPEWNEATNGKELRDALWKQMGEYKGLFSGQYSDPTAGHGGEHIDRDFGEHMIALTQERVRRRNRLAVEGHSIAEMM